MIKLLKAAPNAPKLTDKKQIDSTYKYWRLRILIGTYIGYACFYLTRKSFTFIMPTMIHNLHFPAAQVGAIGSVFYITYGVSKFLSGILSDKSNPRYFMAFGLIITGIANILFGMSSALWLLLVFWLINGFFQGWGWPPCARLLTHWYSQKERGVWWGIWNTSHNLGGFLIPIMAAFLATYYSWRSAMYVPGVIAILIGFYLINRLRDVPSSMGLPIIEDYKNDYPTGKITLEDEKPPVKTILIDYVLTNKYIWVLAFAYVLVYIVRTAINDWGAVFLTEKGFSLVSADTCLSFFEVGGFCGSLVAGWMSDRIFDGCRGQTNVIFSIGVIATILAFWLVPYNSFILYSIITFSIGFLVFGPQMLIGMAAAELSHKEAAGTATGFVGLFGYLGAAIAGLPIGLVVEQYHWSGFFIVVAVCSLATIFLLALLWSVKANSKAVKV